VDLQGADGNGHRVNLRVRQHCVSLTSTNEQSRQAC
jgi:hypothetical protein